MPIATRIPRYNKLQKLFIDGKELTLIDHLKELRIEKNITKKKISNIIKQNDTWYSQIERSGKNGDDNRQKTIYKPDLINIISIIKYGANSISELNEYRNKSEVYIDKIIKAVPLEESLATLEWYQLKNNRTPEEQEKLFESLMESINKSMRQSFSGLCYDDKNNYIDRLKEINASLKIDACFIIFLAGLPFSEFLYEADQNKIDDLLNTVIRTIEKIELDSNDKQTHLNNSYYFNMIKKSIDKYLSTSTRRNKFEPLPIEQMFPNKP